MVNWLTRKSAKGGMAAVAKGGKAAARPATVKRVTMTRVLIGLGVAGVLAIGVKEFPALRRELKIWLM